jgi:predicted membrane-bound spermidine synthase
LSIEDHNSNVNFAISGSKVLVGSRGTNSLLNVGGAGSVAAASGLTFGEDASANLYRSAASTIKTDGNLVVAGATSFNNHKYDSKTVTLTTASYTTVLTISLTAHTSCYVKIGAFGDWGSHSAAAFVSELFIQNGDNWNPYFLKRKLLKKNMSII